MGVARVHLGLADQITIANLDATRDWGHASDFVVAMSQMLQQDTPLDLVIATGEVHSVREFIEMAFREIGIEIQ